MAPIAGELVTEALEYDGGRLVTVYVPPDPAEAIVFAADGAWHIPRLSEALEGASVPSTMIVGAHGWPMTTRRLQEYCRGSNAQRFAAHEKFFVDEVRRWVAVAFRSRVACRAHRRCGVRPSAESWRSPWGFAIRTSTVRSSPLRRAPATSRQGCCRVRFRASTSSLAGKSSSSSRTRRVGGRAAQRDADVVMIERDRVEHGGAFWREEFPLMVAWAFGH